MKTEARFLLAVILMLAVLVGTNRMFPPVIPEATEFTDSTATGTETATRPLPDTSAPVVGAAPTTPTPSETGGLPIDRPAAPAEVA